MTDTDWLNEIEQLTNDAPAGTWYVEADGSVWVDHSEGDRDSASGLTGPFPIWAGGASEFIAAAREAVPRLIERVRELEAERDKAREECGHEKAMRKSASDERDRFIKELMTTRDERDSIAAKLDRVEALHKPSPEQVDDAGVAYRLCLHCTYINRYGRQRYPCPTVTALNEGDDQ